MYFSQWQQAWRIYFLLLQFPLSSVILQCFIIYVFWVLYSWLPRCDCCQNWQNVLLLYKGTVHTWENSLTPKMCFLLWTDLCKRCFFFLYFFISHLFWSFEEKKNGIRIVVTILSCLSIFFFRIWLLLKISWFLKMFQCCCVWCLFLLFFPLSL